MEAEQAHSSLMMEAVRTSEMSVDNYFTRQYIPETILNRTDLVIDRQETAVNLSQNDTVLVVEETSPVQDFWQHGYVFDCSNCICCVLMATAKD
jgi:hypothetical protein